MLASCVAWATCFVISIRIRCRCRLFLLFRIMSRRKARELVRVRGLAAVLEAEAARHPQLLYCVVHVQFSPSHGIGARKNTCGVTCAFIDRWTASRLLGCPNCSMHERLTHISVHVWLFPCQSWLLVVHQFLWTKWSSRQLAAIVWVKCGAWNIRL